MTKKKTRKEIVIERWENAVRVLRALTPHERRKHFNMEFWGEKTDCGTVGCAAGHCGLDPWFRRRGFKLEFDHYGSGDLSTDVEKFFDADGVLAIFYDPTVRSVGTVIKEIQQHIKNIKTGKVDIENNDWY